MRPDKLAVALRPRSGFEACDLGLRLAQRCARPLFLANLALVMGVSSLAYLICAVLLDVPAVGVLVVWWLKPLYDRLALHVLARGVFDATPSAREALRALPGLIRGTSLLRALTLQRFDGQRALRLPVVQLEGLRGKSARARRKLLAGRVSGAGLALLFCFTQFELLLWYGVPALIALIASDNIDVRVPLIELLTGEARDFTAGSMALWHLSYGLVVALLEPFYLASGFALYLKRRSDLEAWDVELQLRKIAAPAATLILATFALVGMLAFGPTPARAAEDPARRTAAIREAPKAVKEILARPEFGYEEKAHRLRWRAAEDKSTNSEWFKSLFKLLSGFARWLVAAWRIILWIALALFACFVIWFLPRQIRRIQAARRAPPPPLEVAGFDIRPESLPDDIAAAAAALCAAGHMREALALLYRGGLSRLAHEAGIPFERGDTEGDCLARVTRAELPVRMFFAELTRNWQDVAYARRTLSADAAAVLCRNWALAFGARP